LAVVKHAVMTLCAGSPCGLKLARCRAPPRRRSFQPGILSDCVGALHDWRDATPRSTSCVPLARNYPDDATIDEALVRRGNQDEKTHCLA
jgi:hypothetical protein